MGRGQERSSGAGARGRHLLEHKCVGQRAGNCRPSLGAGICLDRQKSLPCELRQYPDCCAPLAASMKARPSWAKARRSIHGMIVAANKPPPRSVIQSESPGGEQKLLAFLSAG